MEGERLPFLDPCLVSTWAPNFNRDTSNPATVTAKTAGSRQMSTPSGQQKEQDRGSNPTPQHESADPPKSIETRLSRDSSSDGRGANNAVTSPTSEAMSPGAPDRVFPVRSVVSVDPTPTPSAKPDSQGGYFHGYQSAHDTRRPSQGSNTSRDGTPAKNKAASDARQRTITEGRRGSVSHQQQHRGRLPAQVFSDIISSKSGGSGGGQDPGTSEGQESVVSASLRSSKSSVHSTNEDMGGLITARFKHVITEGGHAVITGRDGETLQRCEDEPIHIPGAVQGFGLLIAVQEEGDGKLVVRIVSENSKRMIGYTPKQLFALDSFCDILSEEQADNMLDHIDFIRDEDADPATNGPEVFTMTIRGPDRKSRKLWCAMHTNERNPNLVICEFELEDDPANPLVPTEQVGELPEDTLHGAPTQEEYEESTQNISRPLRVLRSARKRKGEAAAMEVFNIMSQVQEQLATAPNLETFLKVLVGVVKELTGFHRVMIYQFDQAWNGRVVTELVDPKTTKDLYKGLHFPASDIPKQARELYKINKVRLLYDRDQETARLVCRTLEDLENPLDLTYSYLRAMSPIHLKYLTNMAVRSSMSVSINAFGELWGLISCHSYGPRGMRVSFPIRKMCRLVGDSASRNIERLSYASRLQARKLINTAPTQHNPSGYIIASSDDLLRLFDADFGLLSIRDETKILGKIEQSQEALAMIEYLRMRKLTSVTTSQDVALDFPDLRYPPGFHVIAGMLVVPLSVGGNDFIVFFRKGQLKEVKWAGNPYEKFIKEGTEGYLEPRKSFKTWSETIVGKCREWTEEEIETAAVLCLVYGKFIEVWRQKEAAIQSSELTRLLLANSAHEVRTPLNAIINYLEIALEGSLDQETRDNLAKSHSASKSLIYVINDLLDLTKAEEGVDLIKGETFDLKATLKDATEPFRGDAKRKGINYEVEEHPGVPQTVIGDQRRVRQAISNVCANAIQHTTQGGIKVEMYVAQFVEDKVSVEVAVQDSGIGMNHRKLDQLFRDLEQVETEGSTSLEDAIVPQVAALPDSANPEEKEKRALGLGLAVVARIVKNMNGQLRLKSEEGKGSRFVIQFPFDLPDDRPANPTGLPESEGSVTPQTDQPEGEVTLIDKSAERPGSDHRSGGKMTRKNSRDSLNSRKSMKSLQSISSDHSRKSEADRLIDAIQDPYRPAGVERSMSSHSNQGPQMGRSRSGSFSPSASPRSARARSLDDHLTSPVTPEHQRIMQPGEPGSEQMDYSGRPVKAVRMPDIFGTPGAMEGRVSGEITDQEDALSSTQEHPTADHMNVLVAEDDPVNSKIVKKRLEKLGHNIFLTVNGEECSSTYGEKAGFFDVVLMDMQVRNESQSDRVMLTLRRCPSLMA